MVLVDKEIIKLSESYQMILPFDINNVGPSSYDVRISNKFVKYLDDVLLIDSEPNYEIIEYEKAILLPPGYDIEKYKQKYPNHTVVQTPILSSTVEYIKLPNNIAAIYTGRSSWGRKYIESHMTAGYIDNGFHGTITLEIVAHKPVEIEAGTRIGQLIFFKTNKPIIDYSQKLDAKYNGQFLPTPTKAHLDEVCKLIYVDGSCNKNPGTLGIAGVLVEGTYYCYKYTGKKVTNNIMECLAVYHGLEHIDENAEKVYIVSDSLTIIRALRGETTVRAEPLKYIVEATKNKMTEKVILVHRKGHTKYDKIGKLITSLMKRYNKGSNIVLSDNVKLIDCGDIEDFIKQLRC